MALLTVTTEHLQKIYAHAIENYEVDGWDYFVESFEMEEIIELSERKGCQTYEELFKEVAEWCKTLHEYERDIQGS